MQSNADIQTNRERTERKIINYLLELDFLNNSPRVEKFPSKLGMFPQIIGEG